MASAKGVPTGAIDAVIVIAPGDKLAVDDTATAVTFSSNASVVVADAPVTVIVRVVVEEVIDVPLSVPVKLVLVLPMAMVNVTPAGTPLKVTRMFRAFATPASA
jgi:hypothetical protein